MSGMKQYIWVVCFTSEKVLSPPEKRDIPVFLRFYAACPFMSSDGALRTKKKANAKAKMSCDKTLS